MQIDTSLARGWLDQELIARWVLNRQQPDQDAGPAQLHFMHARTHPNGTVWSSAPGLLATWHRGLLGYIWQSALQLVIWKMVG